METDTFEVGLRIIPFNYLMREARLKMGLTQKQLGELVSVSKEFVGHIETLRHWPGHGLQMRLAEVLGRDASTLFPAWMKPEAIRETLDVEPTVSLTAADMECAPDILGQALLREALHQALEHLTEKQQKVIRLRFGLNDGQPRVYDDVARALGVTRERIRQIEAKALFELRTHHFQEAM